MNFEKDEPWQFKTLKNEIYSIVNQIYGEKPKFFSV